MQKCKAVMVFLCLFLLTLAALPLRIYAEDNAKNDNGKTYIDEINITVMLTEDGGAHITETWKMYVYEGSEVYKIMSNMGNKEITNLSVSDENGNVYENIGPWNVDASKADKNHRCGLVAKPGYYEICFGIGEYGYHEYTMTYDVSNFVEQYLNDQGINFTFFGQVQLEIKKWRSGLHIRDMNLKQTTVIFMPLATRAWLSIMMAAFT